MGALLYGNSSRSAGIEYVNAFCKAFCLFIKSLAAFDQYQI